MDANPPLRAVDLSQLGALCALGIATAFALTRIFDGSDWFGFAIAAVLVPHIVGWLAHRRQIHGLVTALHWFLSGSWLSMIAVVGHETAYGFPTSKSISTWRKMFDQIPEVLDSGRTPATPSGATLLIALVAILVANALSNWAASHRMSAAAAVGPQFALFIFLSAFGDTPYLVATTAFLFTAGVYVAVEYQTSLRENKHWFHSQQLRKSRLISGGIAVSMVVALASATIGPRLPSAQSRGLVDYKGWGDNAGRGSVRIVSPLVNIGDYLNRSENVELFTVESPLRAYWRLVALDNFDGQVWGLAGTVAESGFADPAPGDAVREVTQLFTIGPMGGPFLPAAYRAIDTRYLAKEHSIHDSASLFLDSKNFDGLTYEVDSLVPAPSADYLESLDSKVIVGREKYLELPDDFPVTVANLARDVTSDAHTPYEVALALQAYLREWGGFSYDKTIEGHDTGALENFLLRDRVGFCEQFAGSYAAMARSVGLPARVAIGFTPGTLEPDGRFHVTSDEAHAWPEVHLDGLGWMSFEPTPGRYDPTPGDHTGTGSQDPNIAEPTSPTTDPSVESSTLPTTTQSRGTSPTAPNQPRPTVAPSNGSADRSATATALIAVGYFLAVGAASLIVVCAIVLLVAQVKRHRRRNSRDSRLRVAGAWEQALESLGRAGIHRNPAATPVEFASRGGPAAGVGLAGPALLSLAHLYTEATYSAKIPSDSTADEAWQHVLTIERAIVVSVRLSVRLRRRLGITRSKNPYALGSFGR